MSILTVTPFLWFDDDAADAVELWARVLDDTEVLSETPAPDGGLFMAEISLQGQPVTLMNGGPGHDHSDAFSFSVSVETQDDVDRVSEGLLEGGGEQGPCGWLTDRFGVSWQVVPTALPRLLGDPDATRSAAVMQAMMGMRRIDVAGLQAAYDGA